MATCGIIGAGALGATMAGVLTKGGHEVVLWDKDPSKVPGQQPLEAFVQHVSVLFICVPSWAVRSVVTEIKPYLKPGIPVVSFAKGLESKTNQTAAKIMEEVLTPEHPCVIVGGPMLAVELSHNLPGFAVIASADQAAREMVAGLFVAAHIPVETSLDPHGVALAGVLKNIYALVLGMADGCGWGNNVKGKLAAMALTEMERIGAHVGIPRETIIGTAGLSDFVATGFSEHSNNRTQGQAMAQTGSYAHTTEGIVSVAAVYDMCQAEIGSLPLLQAVHDSIDQRQPAKALLSKILGL